MKKTFSEFAAKQFKSTELHLTGRSLAHKVDDWDFPKFHKEFVVGFTAPLLSYIVSETVVMERSFRNKGRGLCLRDEAVPVANC